MKRLLDLLLEMIGLLVLLPVGLALFVLPPGPRDRVRRAFLPATEQRGRGEWGWGEVRLDPGTSRRRIAYDAGKRVVDIILASLGLVLVLPLCLLLGLAIKLADGGPILYAQTRVGRFGRPFRIWKLRSMVVNADRVGLPVTRNQDPRVTTLGRLLRKTKLDELPQLWNVLLGHMSLVGPRPEVPKYVGFYTDDQREVLRLKPGLTDLASIRFRNEETLLQAADDVEVFYLRKCVPRKIDLNLQYARKASLLRDLGVLVKTFFAVALGAGEQADVPAEKRPANPAPANPTTGRTPLIK